jgi:phenylacetate-CoA ligase
MIKRASVMDLLRGNIPGIAWPPVTREPLAGLVALLAVLDRTQWMKRRDLVAQQYRQLEIVAGHLARVSNQFRDRLERAGLAPSDLASEAGLRRLPVLRRRDLQGAPADLFSRSIPQSHMPLGESRTSGSTGEPVLIRRTAVNQLVWRAMNIRCQVMQGTDFTKPCTTIRPQFTSYAVRTDRGPPVSQLFESGPVQAIPITMAINEQAARLREFAPENLIIYPTNLDGLCRYAKANDIVFKGLNTVFTIGETLSPRIRQEVEAVLGARVIDKYSSQEVGMIAAECPDSGLYHVMAESLIVEVLKPDGSPCRAGEVGRVAITDLHNFATPIVRYDIGDYAEVGGACPCGRGSPTLKRILGRERNLMTKPDGSQNWPLVGFHQFRDIAPILQYQFIQHDLERIEVKMVSETPLSPAQEAKLTSVMQQALGHPFKLQFTYFDNEIPRTPGGKLEEFVSLIPPQHSALAP